MFETLKGELELQSSVCYTDSHVTFGSEQGVETFF